MMRQIMICLFCVLAIYPLHGAVVLANDHRIINDDISILLDSDSTADEREVSIKRLTERLAAVSKELPDRTEQATPAPAPKRAIDDRAAVDEAVQNLLNRGDAKFRLDQYSHELYQRIKQNENPPDALAILRAFNQANLQSRLQRDPDLRRMVSRFIASGDEKVALAAAELFTTGEFPMSDDHAVATLLDSHAASTEKMSAIRVLEESQSPGDQRFIFALSYACHCEIKSVRDKAKEVVVRMIGKEDADRLASAALPQDNNFFAQLEGALVGLKGAGGIASMLASEKPEDCRAGLERLTTLIADQSHYLPSLRESFRAHLVTHLERIDFVEPSFRPYILKLVQQLDPARMQALPLIARIWTDDDPEVRTFIQRLAITDIKRPEHQLIGALIINAIANADGRISTAAWELLARIPEESIQKQSDQLLAASVTAAAQGNFRPASLILAYKINRRRFAQAVYDQYFYADAGGRTALTHALLVSGAQREFDDLNDAHESFAEFLAAGRQARNAEETAKLFSNAKLHIIAVDQLISLIKSGQTANSDALKSLHPDPESLSNQLAEFLRAGDPEVRHAAIQTLAITGVKGDAIHAVLVSLLRSPDEILRHTSAQILNTPEAFARAKVVDLLGELRSDSLTARQLAARQLDELGIEPREVTSALVRAVESGDFAARQGLLSALQSANTESQNPLEVLKRTATTENANAAPRAFARAALRQIDLIGIKPEAKP